MNRYWTRIAMGAVLIFGLGLAGLAAVRKGKAEVRSLLATTASRLPLRFASLGFRLDGRRIGELVGVDIVRAGSSDIGKLTGHVELTAPDAASTLRSCNLAVQDTEWMNDRSTFYCASPAELQSGELVEAGSISFEPDGLNRPLYLPQRVVGEWQRSSIQQLDASLTRDGRGGVQASGKFDVADAKHGPQKGRFELRADSSGASLVVRDEFDRPLVNFHADQLGLKLNIQDRHGRNLLRMLADSLGVALRGKP